MHRKGGWSKKKVPSCRNPGGVKIGFFAENHYYMTGQAPALMKPSSNDILVVIIRMMSRDGTEKGEWPKQMLQTENGSTISALLERLTGPQFRGSNETYSRKLSPITYHRVWIRLMSNIE
mgnify:CR=1 FL=1